MKKALLANRTIEETNTHTTGMKIGKIVQIDDSGQILVDFPENQSGPVITRVTTSVKRDVLSKGNPAGREVLLAFENNDPQYPVIVDTMYSLIDEITEHSTVVLEAESPQDAIIDGKRIVFDAQEEVVIRCGKGSISLFRDGRVIIKGTNLLSRSSGAHRIKGASVNIN